MTLLDELNHFRGSLLTKTVIDRKQRIVARADGTADCIGPPWPDIVCFLNHINHARYRDGLGPHLFQITFTMAHDLTGSAALVAPAMEVTSITLAAATATISMQSGDLITFRCASVTIKSRAK